MKPFISVEYLTVFLSRHVTVRYEQDIVEATHAQDKLRYEGAED